MKKQMKILITIAIFLSLILVTFEVHAVNTIDGQIEISQNYLEYLELTEEEKKNVMAPKMYDIPKSKIEITNPFKLGKFLGSSLQTKYSLKDIIPENVIVKNQLATSTCWAFSSLASLETHLALQDYKNGKDTVVYDLSERHMDYATTKVFLNGQINEFGFNRKPGSNGVIGIPTAYLTNGLGAVAEDEMPFSENVDLIDINEIQNKNVITQVNDIITFPSYTELDDRTQIKQQMKEHIMNYGGINASINASANQAGAIYCDNSVNYKIDHSVVIVGWDDEYSTENFDEWFRPKNPGAWIAKNSYGEEIGDNGFWYISYDDALVYKQLVGITNAQTEKNYENIYQYDELGGYLKFTKNGTSKIYLATEFNKKTEGKEYLTQVSINASEAYTCKVYVNPNGTSKEMKDLQQVELKTGESETFEAGYHTIEFAKPIKIGDNFVIVLEIEGKQADSISMLTEVNFGEFFTDPIYANAANHVYDTVTIADSKCFFGAEEEIKNNQWTDTSKLYENSEGKLPNLDTTIKAFTTSKILENIEVTTPPAKTVYVEGQDFDKTGMQIKANYANGDAIEITDYTIQNGTNLTLGQTDIIISYNEFTTKQPIEVVKNTVENITITTPPKVTEYLEGEDFNPSEMVVEATYRDGKKEIITDYTIENGTNLKNKQTTVTISYQGKKAIQQITVKPNSVVKLEIISNAKKLNYVVGQNFNPEGLKLKAIYQNGLEKEITDYSIKDGQNLKAGQTTVTIEYEGKTIIQEITVENKEVVSIEIKSNPTKTEYIQNKEELDLNGGIIKIIYNDGTEEEVLMTSKEISISGFNNQILGTNTIIIKYQGKTAEFKVEIKEPEKPQNSNFDKVQGKIDKIKLYYFTDKTKKEYGILDIIIENVAKATGNDNIEYYYYLSTNPNEENIAKWIKTDTKEISETSFSFEINTLEIPNYEELASANKLYLYTKEVATKNDMKSEKIVMISSIEAENINIEKYVDGKKEEDINSGDIIDSTPGENPDNTLAPGTIPNAGKNILIIASGITIIVISLIIYFKYKDIEIK